MLLGIGLISRGVGTTQISALAEVQILSPGVAGAGVGLFVLGLALKAGAAPFHFWLGAAYGRVGGTTALALGAVGAIGALGVLVRVAGFALAAPALGEGVANALVAIGAFSVAVGSLQAIGARNLRRMAAYAGGAQAGCIILSVALGSPAGFAAALVQMFAMCAAALAMFGGAAAIGGNGALQSLDGLGKRAPLASVALSAGALSLMGAPLTIGFLGRWRMIEAGVGVGWWWAAGAVIAASLAAVFYGGRLIERLYFRKSTLPFEGDGDLWRVLIAPALLIAIAAMAMGLEPSWLLRAADAAAALMSGPRHERGTGFARCARGAGAASDAGAAGAASAGPARRDPHWVRCNAATAAGVLANVAAHGETTRVVLARPLPGVDLAFSLEPLGALMAALMAGLGVLHAVHTAGMARATHDKGAARLMAYIALASAAAMGVAYSANLFTFFVAYQALTLATFPLIAHGGDEEARRAARNYLATLLAASVGLLLPAMVWTYAVAGALDFRPGGVLAGRVDAFTASALLVLYVLGLAMAAVPPMHRWLSSSSRAPHSALVSILAITVLPAGGVGLIKIAAYVFGSALHEAAFASRALLILVGIGMCVAALIALSKQDLRERLAYSAWRNRLPWRWGRCWRIPTGLFAAALQIVALACGAATLTMAAGTVYAATGRTEARDTAGLGRVMPWTFAGFAIGFGEHDRHAAVCGRVGEALADRGSRGHGTDLGCGACGRGGGADIRAPRAAGGERACGASADRSFQTPGRRFLHAGGARDLERGGDVVVAGARRSARPISRAVVDASAMSPTPKPQGGGAAAMLFLFCIAGGGAGLAFDLALNPDRGFWFGAQPGARAVIGAAAAVFVVLAGYAARLLLGRRDAKGGGDGSHP